MLNLYYYLVNYPLQSVANIFKTVETMQKLISKSASATSKTSRNTKKGNKQKFVA